MNKTEEGIDMTTAYKTVITRLTTILVLLACFLLVPRAVYAEADIPDHFPEGGNHPEKSQRQGDL